MFEKVKNTHISFSLKEAFLRSNLLAGIFDKGKNSLKLGHLEQVKVIWFFVKMLGYEGRSFKRRGGNGT